MPYVNVTLGNISVYSNLSETISKISKSLYCFNHQKDQLKTDMFQNQLNFKQNLAKSLENAY